MGISYFTPEQRRLFKKWFFSVLLAEIVMFILNRYLFFCYLAVGVLFLGSLLLRLLGIYSEKPEPQALDLSAVLIALIFAGISFPLKNNPWRFLLILISSLIILPHLWYIYSKEKEVLE